MGRKPNQIIVNYFERGARLDDNSNRYAHTCKSCGELFPKGRSEGLITHLTRRCPSLSLAERTAIVLQVHDLAAPEDASPDVSPIKSTRRKRNSSPQSSPKQGFNALNVLAEASRRVGARDGSQLVYDPSPAKHFAGLNLPAGHDAGGFPTEFINHVEDGYISRPHGMHDIADQGIANGSQFQIANHPSSSHAEVLEFAEHGSPSKPSDLPSIAALAHGIVPLQGYHAMPEEDPNSMPTLDELHNQISLLNEVPEDDQHNFQWPTLSRMHSADQGTIPDPVIPLADITMTTTNLTERPLLATTTDTRPESFAQDAGMLTGRKRKQRLRGKFTPQRRKEVLEMRKIGACIRCRMLRKPCTGSNPCDACGRIKNPRLYKDACLRNKVTDEFISFFILLQPTLAFHEIQQLKETTTFKLASAETYAEIFVHEQVGSAIRFRVLMGRPSDSEFEHTSGASQDEDIINESPKWILDTENASSATEVGTYLKTLTANFMHCEKSPFVKTLLSTALQLSETQEDKELNESIELWMVTTFLVDEQISFKPVIHAKVRPTSTTMTESFVNLQNFPASFSAIRAQFKALVERHVHALGRDVVHSVDRRRLRAQIYQPQFSLFVAGLLILNCCERLTWLLYSRETSQSISLPDNKTAESYAKHAQILANVLLLMFNVRSVPPKTSFEVESGILMPDIHEDETLHKFYKDARLTLSSLEQFGQSIFIEGDCRSMDGSLMSRFLLPDGEGPAQKSDDSEQSD